MYLIKNFSKLSYQAKFLVNQIQYSCRTLCSSPEDKMMIDEEEIKNERVFQDLNPNQFKSLATNESIKRKIETILSNYEYLKYRTLEVPTTLKTKDMTFLLDLDLEEWDRHLKYLYKIELKTLFHKKLKNINKTLKKEELTNKWKDRIGQRTGIFDDNGDIVYGLWHNSLFTRISPQYLRKYSAHRLRNASIFGQKVVFDLTCDPLMSQIESHSKLKQLVKSYQTNRYQFREPFDLIFCNLNKSTHFWKLMEEERHNPYKKFPYFVSDFTQKSYIDLFDKKRLVYLTPCAEKQLEFDLNHIYIISLSDGSFPKNYHSILSRREGIVYRKLPIDSYVFWNGGHSKDLKSYTVLSILNDVREGLGWKDAIERNVPKFFIKTVDEIKKEEDFRLKKMIERKENPIKLRPYFK